MGDRTKIEWCDATWSPVTGCSHTSPGCLNCYAERMDRRQMMPGRKDGFRPWTAQNAEYNVRLHPERLGQPLHFRKPRRIFVNSMSDLFHEQVPFQFIAAVFGVMAHSKHIYQVLTKRPKGALEFFDWLGALRGPCGRAPCDPLGGCEIQAARNLPVEWSVKVANLLSKPAWPLPNVWLGVSAEDQKTLDERMPLLLQTPAAVRWVSLEPLLGPIILDDVGGGGHTSLTTDWVVAGGESGPSARPCHPEWLRSLRDQCGIADVAFFLKQRGEFLPMPEAKACGLRWTQRACEMASGAYYPEWMCRVGKKAAGRELDGRTWDEFPEVS